MLPFLVADVSISKQKIDHSQSTIKQIQLDELRGKRCRLWQLPYPLLIGTKTRGCLTAALNVILLLKDIFNWHLDSDLGPKNTCGKLI